MILGPATEFAADPARDGEGRYRPGHTGNRRGRPKGTCNHQRLTARLDKLVAAEAVGLVEGLLERARAGDVAAAAVLLARPWAGSEARP